MTDGRARATSEGARVLVVEDDENMRAFLLRALEQGGHQVHAAPDRAGALHLARGRSFDLVLLDVGLPDGSGLDIISELRAVRDVPTIVVSGRTEEADRVLGFVSGADDYIVKPFSPRELLLRVEAVLRRVRPADTEDRLEFGALVLDVIAREVWLAGQRVEITRREFELLAFLATHPRRTFTREELLREVWESSSQWQDPRTVTEHVRRIRQRLAAEPPLIDAIVTIPGVGYRFDPPNVDPLGRGGGSP